MLRQFLSRTVLLALCTCLLSLSCARLPRVHYLRKPRDPKAEVGMEDNRGKVAPSKAQVLLERRMAKAGLDVRERALLEEAATGRPLLTGNKVRLLFDGPETMGAMMASIAAARQTINLETYIFDQDELGLKFAELLMAKQREGVQVNILYDCVGTLGTPEAFFSRMRDAGIRLCPYNPVNPLALHGGWRLNHRDHRKILVVDGLVAYTGGANISGAYRFGSLFRRRAKAPKKLGWRDTHLRIEGPAVAALQLLFVETWFSQLEEGLDTGAFFPRQPQAGDTLLRVVGSRPGGDFEIYRAYVLALEQATRTIHLTAAYFVPDAQILGALTQAARRGVEVEIILTTLTDSSLVQRASQSFYEELLNAGVRVFQLKSSILHAKTAVIDGVWSTVGSTNLDMRSFMYNDEVNVIVVDAGFAAEMEKAFEEDKRNSEEVESGAWRKRPRCDRMKEWSARILEPWL